MLRIVSLGSIVDDPRFIYRNKHKAMPYPVGYTMERGVFIGAGGNALGEKTKVLFPGDEGADAHVADVYFTASIKKGLDGGSLFEVIRSDRPDIVHSGDNPSTPWRKAFDAAAQDFSERLGEIVGEKRDAKGGMVVRGPRWFGLTLDIISARLKTLPGASVVFCDGKDASRGGKKTREGGAATATAATTTEKGKKDSRTRSSAASSQQIFSQTDASASSKRRRVTKKEQNDDSDTKAIIDDDDVPLNVLVTGRNSGLHEPCQVCGLRTSFCPMTGKPHGVAKSQRSSGVSAQGEALGKKSRIPLKSNVPSDTVETASNRAGRKRLRDTNGVDAANAPTVKRPRGASSKPATRQKTVKVETPSASSASTQGGQRRRLVQLKLPGQESKTESVDLEEMPLTTLLARKMLTATGSARTVSSSLPTLPSPTQSPFWRPPLAEPESQKALRVLQRLIRAEEVIHAPFASLLHLPLVASAKSRTVKKKKQGGEDTTVAEEPGEDAGGVMDEDNSAAATIAEKKKNLVEGKDRHPLDITDVAFSVAGKRYVKFMQLYTSERMKLDLLKKADVIQPVQRTRGTEKKHTETTEGVAPASSSSIHADEENNEVKQEPQQS
ncbi:ISWI complex protein [Trypanosoma cruzi]|nr:ISWI complex protein [Trypanosoma cruzi]